MKRLIIFRHGDFDQNHQLTIDGIKEVYGRSKLIFEIIGKVDLILTSPILRALQTAAVIGKAMNTSNIIEEPLLAEQANINKDLIQETIISYTWNSKYETLAAVTHYPNIKQAFGISLEPGMEIIFESKQWDNIFKNFPSNILSKINAHKKEYIEKYFFPHCTKEDLQSLKEINFLQADI